MTAQRLAVLLIAPLFIGACGPSESDRSRDAVLRVLKADQELSRKRDDATRSAPTPSQLAIAIDGYCNELERIEMSDCPADFRVAYRVHMRSWRELQIAIAQLPDGFASGMLMGLVNGLMGEADGGVGRLQGDLKRAMSNVQSTFDDVEKTGAKYGAAL